MPFDGTKNALECNADLAALRRARAGVSQPGGWVQGSYGWSDVHCAIGWLLLDVEGKLALGFQEYFPFPRARLLLPALPPDFKGINGNDAVKAVLEFNDRAGRTQEEIVALFDRAILLLEAKLGCHALHGAMCDE